MDDSIDSFVAHANELVHSDYRAFIEYCNGTKFHPAVPLVGDPFSANYRAAVLENYCYCAGVDDYRPIEHELAKFGDVEAPLARQFPFTSRDALTVGRYLSGVGHVLANLGLASGATILEYGSGWGHLALMLGRIGMKVYCVDLEPGFVELINRSASGEAVDVTAQVGQFGERPKGMEKADAVIFFEAFHHSLDHLAVCQKVNEMLRPGGCLFLCGEAIYPWFEVPWGLRLDGHSVWAIRSFKWMELGFQEDYAITLLLRCGFFVEKRVNSEIGPLGVLYLGMKPNGAMQLCRTMLPSIEAKSWCVSPEQGGMFSRAASLMSIADLAGWSSVEIKLRNCFCREANVTLSQGKMRRKVTVQPEGELAIVFPIERGAGPMLFESDACELAEIETGDGRQMVGIAVESLQYI